MTTIPKHILSIHDFPPEYLFGDHLEGCKDAIIATQRPKIYSLPGFARSALTPKILRPKAQFAFFEPSTRTRGSSVEAAQRLNWRMDSVTGAEATSLSKKETLANTGRMFALYGADAIVLRTKIEGAPRFMAQVLESMDSDAVIINAGDGTNQHPTQTVLDILTMSAHLNRLDDLTLGVFGDLRYGRTVHSLLNALKHRSNIRLVLVSPQQLALQDYYSVGFASVSKGEDMEMLNACDVIYGARIQAERSNFNDLELKRWGERYVITKAHLARMRSDVKIMHPMPYLTEFPPEVRRDDRIIIDSQAWHGVPARMFMLANAYKHRRDRQFTGNDLAPTRNPLRDGISLEEYMEQQGHKKKGVRYFRPIDDGIVVDHVEAGLGARISELLEADSEVPSDCAIHLIRRVESTRSGTKEVVILHNAHPSDSTLAAVQSMSPGIRFNEVKDGQVTKYQIVDKGPIRGRGKCPNTNCITNHDPEAQTEFTPSDGGKNVRCGYCEKHFRMNEI